MAQSAQVKKTLAAFKMNDCNPAPTPFNAGPQPSSTDAEPTSPEAPGAQSFPYREIVGSLGPVSYTTPTPPTDSRASTSALDAPLTQ